MRRIASQVPESVGRLLQSGHIKSPPTWFIPVLQNPPPRIAPRRSKLPTNINQHGEHSAPSSTRLKAKARAMRAPKESFQSIRYEEDEIRRRFYMDFPFEALRPVSLVEMREVQAEHHIRGKEWTSLAQRGAYATVEDAIAFTLKLHDEGMSMTNAYKQATKEFVKLRARYEMTQMASELEARFFGAEFKETPIERHFRKEREYLDSHLAAESRTANSGAARVRWKPPKDKKWSTHVEDAAVEAGEFTGGKAYVERWRTLFTSSPEAGVQDDTNAVSGLKSEDDFTGRVTESKHEPEDSGMNSFDFLRQALSQSQNERK